MQGVSGSNPLRSTEVIASEGLSLTGLELAKVGTNWKLMKNIVRFCSRIFILLRRPMGKILKGIALLLFAPALLVGIRIAGDKGSASDYLWSMTWEPTLWALIYLGALIACAVGIFRFGKKEPAEQPVGAVSSNDSPPA